MVPVSAISYCCQERYVFTSCPFFIFWLTSGFSGLIVTVAARNRWTQKWCQTGRDLKSEFTDRENDFADRMRRWAGAQAEGLNNVI